MHQASPLETAQLPVDPAIALGALAASPFPPAAARGAGPLPEALPIAAAWEWGAVVPVSLAEADGARRARVIADRVALAVVSVLSIAAVALAACL
jgi:hypothetical protein